MPQHWFVRRSPTSREINHLAWVLLTVPHTSRLEKAIVVSTILAEIVSALGHLEVTAAPTSQEYFGSEAAVP